MSEIPEDIIETARSCWPSARDDAAPIHMTISRAILAERQRCADVARHLNGWGPVGGHHVAEHIAHTILNP